MASSKYKEVTREKLEELNNNGYTYDAICDYFHILDVATIVYYFKKFGIKKKKSFSGTYNNVLGNRRG